MPSRFLRPSLIAVLCLATAPVFAESLTTSASSAASSASSAGSASSRGSSDSLRASSDSSSGTEEKTTVIDGDYRVAAIDAIDGRPGMLRLTMDPLAAEAGGQRLELDLPAVSLGDRPVVAGDVIAARNRPYGVEFARGQTPKAFFLVMADAWNRDLDTRPLVR